MTDEHDEGAADPELREAVSAAVRRSALGRVAEDEEAPLGQAVIRSIGGVRGLVESILPSFLFLVVFLATTGVLADEQRLWASVLAPVLLAIVFVVIRGARRAPLTPAITGLVGVAITAALAIVTNRAENNFVPGILLNLAFLLAMLVSLAARRPLIGLVVAILLGERAADWRSTPRPRRVLTLATWLWVGLFAIRLAVEVPLYLLENAAGLALAKLVLGVPFYAVVLWCTWLLVRSVYPPATAEDTAD